MGWATPLAMAQHTMWTAQKRRDARLAEARAAREAERRARAQRGDEGGRWVHDVPCPVCQCEGPHERIGVSPIGDSIVVLCSDNLCSLTWNVSGPPRQRDL